ncbi:MAG: N-acetyltransferase [Brevinematia bacterium]
MDTLIIREASLEDVDSIFNLMKPFVDKGDLLPRSKDDITDHIRNFIVAEVDGKVVGSMAIKFYSREMVEFRSLVVDVNFQGKGIGAKLVNEGIEIVKEMGVKRVFVLTRSENFFKKLGFYVVKKDIFPEKIWFDCMLCPKLNNCDEIPMLKNIK